LNTGLISPINVSKKKIMPPIPQVTEL